MDVCVHTVDPVLLPLSLSRPLCAHVPRPLGSTIPPTRACCMCICESESRKAGSGSSVGCMSQFQVSAGPQPQHCTERPNDALEEPRRRITGNRVSFSFLLSRLLPFAFCTFFLPLAHSEADKQPVSRPNAVYRTVPYPACLLGFFGHHHSTVPHAQQDQPDPLVSCMAFTRRCTHS